jgi:DNA-binding FadR family transcriptional regulator
LTDDPAGLSTGQTNWPVRPQEGGTKGEDAREDDALPLAAIEPRRLYQQVADHLRQLIDEGEYPVGSRLPAERELAVRLGVSRPTVREALIALEVQGRLRIRVGSGIYVTAARSTTASPGREPIEGPFEVLRARAFVESAVAEEAARRATDADVARLDAILAEIDDEPLVRERWIPLDRRFHLAVVATLNNAVLMRTIGELFDQRINPYFDRLARYIVNESTWRAAHEEHVAIRDAIAARDPERACAAMHEHLKRSHRRFAEDFGEQPVQDGLQAQRGRKSGREYKRAGTDRG